MANDINITIDDLRQYLPTGAIAPQQIDNYKNYVINTWYPSLGIKYADINCTTGDTNNNNCLPPVVPATRKEVLILSILWCFFNTQILAGNSKLSVKNDPNFTEPTFSDKLIFLSPLEKRLYSLLRYYGLRYDFRIYNIKLSTTRNLYKDY